MIEHYHAHGKLLISAEYVVMHGARALAVPIKMGQDMEVYPVAEENRRLSWTAYHTGTEWFSATLSLPDLTVLEASDPTVGSTLRSLLLLVQKSNHEIFTGEIGYRITTHTGFNRFWGLGSSAALAANLSQWAGLDAYELAGQVFGGSGYDVAAALAEGPIVYQRSGTTRKTEPVFFLPAFRNRIWFGYLGRKQSTAEAIGKFNEKTVVGDTFTRAAGDLTDRFIRAENLESFMAVMHEHEIFIADLLEEPPVGRTRFADFDGEIKSLGAWGGDFIMIASNRSESYVREYFSDRQIEPVFTFDELILNRLQ